MRLQGPAQKIAACFQQVACLRVRHLDSGTDIVLLDRHLHAQLTEVFRRKAKRDHSPTLAKGRREPSHGLRCDLLVRCCNRDRFRGLEKCLAGSPLSAVDRRESDRVCSLRTALGDTAGALSRSDWNIRPVAIRRR
jgi:hypothetical protein